VHGYAGGIVVVWKKELISVSLNNKKFQFILMREWFFTAIYASPNEENGRLLSEDLKQTDEGMIEP
jgi:hypothetical protein